MPENWVEIQNLIFTRDNRCIFDNIDMVVKQGKITAIMGPSGSGKTTLLRLIGAQLTPDSGEIRVFGQNIHQLSRKALYKARRDMGLLFQSSALFTHLTVFENVAFPLREHTELNPTMLRDIVLMKLEAVGLRVPLIALTGNTESVIAKTADVHLDVSIQQEACPLGLAPTTSTTVALVMGDALAIALLQARGFSAEDFALSHPGGALGKKLLLRIDELFHQAENLPIINQNALISEALIEVTNKKLGMTCVVDNMGFLVGVYTDGDIRRTLTHQLDINTAQVKDVMNHNTRVIQKGMLAAEALAIMEKYAITSLVVIDDNNRPIAVLHLHDLLRAGVL